MDATQLISEMAKRGDLIGFAIAVCVAGIALYFRYLTPVSHKKPESVDVKGLSKVADQVADIDRRLSRVETHVDDLPTRAEFHEIDKAMTRLAERSEGIERLLVSTTHAVHRIEDYMIRQGGSRE